MTEHHIAGAIENTVTSHEGVTDFPVTYEQIMDEVDTLRIRTIEEQDKAGLLAAPYNLMTQTIEFTTINKTTDNKLWVECPRLFTLQGERLAIAYVGSLNDDKPYRVSVGRQVKFAKADRWNKNEPLAHFKDGKIFLHNIAPSKFVLRAIFERPRDLEKYGYNPEKSDYPLSNGKIDVIIGKTAESYIRTMYRTRPQPNQQVDLPQGNA